MRGFLQISPTGTYEKIATRHLFFRGINTFHLLHSRDPEVKEQIRNGTIAKRLTGPDTINSTKLFLKCSIGLETWQECSNQCELIEMASKIIEIGAQLSVGRQIESEEVKCLREISGRLTSW